MGTMFWCTNSWEVARFSKQPLRMGQCFNPRVSTIDLRCTIVLLFFRPTHRKKSAALLQLDEPPQPGHTEKGCTEWMALTWCVLWLHLICNIYAAIQHPPSLAARANTWPCHRCMMGGSLGSWREFEEEKEDAEREHMIFRVTICLATCFQRIGWLDCIRSSSVQEH